MILSLSSTRRSFLFSLLLAGCCICNVGFSQDSKSADKKLKSKKDPRAAVKAWDKNKNGMLEPSEIPDEQRGKVLAWAEKKGMNTKKPLKLETLFAKEKLTQEEKDAKKAARKKTVKEKKADNKKGTEKPTNSKAFGVSARARVKGRIEAANKLSKEASEDDKKNERAERRRGAFRFAARSLMYQNDKNKNGRLEKSEWSRLKGDPNKADKNKDGSLSQEELTEHLAGYGSNEEKPRPKRRQTAKRRSNPDAGKKSYRFLTPQERLPEGLPDWFMERDDNLDGQISLKEYAPSLTSAKYEKFAQLDLDNDGLLVAKEYLEATK